MTEIKKAIFSVFGVAHLDNIKEKDGLDEIRVWKQSEKTKWCRQHLGQQMDPNDKNSPTFLEAIYSKVYPTADQTPDNAAFTVAIAEAMLDPDTTTTVMSKELVFPRMRMKFRASETSFNNTSAESFPADDNSYEDLS